MRGPLSDTHEQLPARRSADLSWARHPAQIQCAPCRYECRCFVACSGRDGGVGRSLAAIESTLAEHLALQAASMPVLHVAAIRHVPIVHDPFHITERVIVALDEVRKEVFFRAGPSLRRLGGGHDRRWLLLRAWGRNTRARSCSASCPSTRRSHPDQGGVREVLLQTRPRLAQRLSIRRPRCLTPGKRLRAGIFPGQKSWRDNRRNSFSVDRFWYACYAVTSLAHEWSLLPHAGLPVRRATPNVFAATLGLIQT